jgi:hypothetical protein
MKRAPLVIVDRHNKVLPAWAEFRARLSEAPRLITLDYHTDTSKPFRNYLKYVCRTPDDRADKVRKAMISEVDFSRLDSVRRAVGKLGNDEHIVTAIEADIISSAFVIAHNAMTTDLATYRDHRIMCYSVDRTQRSRRVAREDCDRVLESPFLNEVIASFNALLLCASEPVLGDRPYILDIDLDYFTTWQSVVPHDASAIRELIRHAGLITIATEPDYVKTCALDRDLSSEALLSKLSTLLPDLKSES